VHQTYKPEMDRVKANIMPCIYMHIKGHHVDINTAYQVHYHMATERSVQSNLSKWMSLKWITHLHTHTHTRLVALFLGLPRSAGTRKVKPIWILLKQETLSGSGISWAVCKSATRSRQITMPAPHHSIFYRPDALPAAQPTASKH